MPAEVKILIEGFTNADSVSESGEERTQPTVTLIKDGDLIMVVDPGVMESQQILIEALKRESLTVQDVNMVCITHSHFDHFRNIGMFPNAKTLEYYGVWHENTIDNWSKDFTSNIKIIHTPGHDVTGLTLFVTTDAGVVAICGDVFWKKNYPADPKDDAFASNPEVLKESRKMVLRMADFVIPGHGPMYRNNINEAHLEDESTRQSEKEISEIFIKCKHCGRQMKQKDKCLCRPHLCFKCCECGFDCDICNCSHERM